MGMTAAQRNRKVRQEALRDQLEAQGHVQHVNDIANKLLDLTEQMEQLEVQRLKSAADVKIRLINKYLPDLKATEITGEGGGPVELTDMTDAQLESRLRAIIESQSED